MRITLQSLFVISTLLLVGCSSLVVSSSERGTVVNQVTSSVPSATTTSAPSPFLPTPVAPAPTALSQPGTTSSQKLSPVPTASGPYDPPVAVLVTRDNAQLPAGCRPWDVAGLITNFFDAFNRGDQAQLARLWMLPERSKAQGSVWYSVTEGLPAQGGRNVVVYNQEDLLAYFAERYTQNERLQLLMVDVGGNPGSSDVGISYVLTRSADDLPPGLGGPERLADGKGMINCREQKLFVWSMSQNVNAQESITWPCPKLPDWQVGTSVIACSRQ